MSVLDFLFEGKPPASVTTYGSSTESLPQWLSDYTQGLIAKANAIGAEPYQGYPGARIASFTPDQLGSFQKTRDLVGAADPFFSQAGNVLTRTSGFDPVAIASPDLNTARSQFGEATAISPTSVASPYLGQAGQQYNQAVGFSPLDLASPYFQTGAQTFPGAVDQYMNPYIENVLNRQQSLAQRNLEENFLPALQDAFTGSGQFGSERMMEMGQRGVRDITEGLEEQRLATLGQAYGQAADIFGQDASRAATIGSNIGQLGVSQRAGDIDIGTQLANLGLRAGELAGSEQAQRANIANQLASMGVNVGQLAGQGAELGISSGRELSNLGQTVSAQKLRDAAALEAIGSQQQKQTQSSLDLAYQDFLRQQQYPRETVDWLSGIVRGLPASTQTTSSTTGPSDVYQPSPLSQIASAYSLYQGLT